MKYLKFLWYLISHKRYWKYIGLVLFHGLMYILGIFFFLPAYWIKPKKGFLWLFLNDENMYGYRHSKYWKHYGKEKWWVAYRWNVFRNSHWNARTLFKERLSGKHLNINIIENYPETLSGLRFRSFEHYDKYGDTKQFSEFNKKEREYFRYSEVKKVKYWLLKPTYIRQIMFGWSNTRWIFKIRHRKI